MAIARDGTGATKILWEGVGNGGQVITFTTTASRHLVVSGESNSPAVTVADSGSGSWTVKSRIMGVGTGVSRVFVAYREDAAAVTTVTVTLSGGTNYGGAKLDQFTGVKTSGSFESETTADGTTASATFGSGNHTTTDPNALVIGAASGDDTSTAAWTTTLGSWTELAQDGNATTSLPWQTIYQIAVGSTGPYSLTWNYPPMNGSYAGVSLLVSFASAVVTSVATYANTPRDDELIALGSVLGPYSWVKPQSWF